MDLTKKSCLRWAGLILSLGAMLTVPVPTPACCIDRPLTPSAVQADPQPIPPAPIPRPPGVPIPPTPNPPPTPEPIPP
ncbi:MAG TPA: hypothetical protein VFQ06_10385, partial [Nitrospira sp.]|nr:hypothetical protein [Nitrospira sp.]